MKKITETNYIFDENDLTMIMCSSISEDPCKNCGAGLDCRGCPKKQQYNLLMRTLDDANVLEFALKYNKYFELKKEKEDLEIQMNNIEKEFFDIFEEKSPLVLYKIIEGIK